MISLEKKEIFLRGQAKPIAEFQVWFRTPLGITDDLDFAITRCKEQDWEPQLTIVPVVVALSIDGTYEEFAYK